MLLTAYVWQRLAAHQRPEQLRVLREHDTHQQAVGAGADGAELRGGRDAAVDEVGGDRGGVFGRLVSAGPRVQRFVPAIDATR